jgi:phosphorylase superfamily protein
VVSRQRVRDIVTIVAATRTEANAVRRIAAENVRVVECGIAALHQASFDGLAISCGLAGGLRDDLPTGTVLIPARVARTDGTAFDCDAAAIDALTSAAQQGGYRVVHDPLVTSERLVRGEERRILSGRGYAGVDMETGLLKAPRIACVRVILDTPQREISPAWLRPATALLHPRAWFDLPFLVREGPRCSAIAAAVAASAALKL